MKQIKVTITPMGDPIVEAIGFTGASCDAATKPIEDALSGGKGGNRELKPEFMQSEQTTEVQQGW